MPYLLGQAATARHGATSAPFWAAVKNDVAEADDAWWSEPAVATWEGLLGDSFFHERLGGDSVGEPLLGLTGHQLDGGTGGQVTVQQIQHDGSMGRLVTDLGEEFALFHDVPFVLGCRSLEWDDATASLQPSGSRPYSECDADGDQVYSVQVLSPEAGALEQARTLTLTAASGMNTDTGDAAFADPAVVPFEASTQAVGVALLAHHQLLQDHIGDYGIHDATSPPPADFLPDPVAVTWQLACGRGSRAGTHVLDDCLADGDGDGWPLPGDCNDTLSAAFPGALDPVTLWQEGDPLNDIDCDTWPVDFWSYSPVP
jgi:hypothetical protein